MRRAANAFTGKGPPGAALSVGTLSLIALGGITFLSGNLKRSRERMYHHLLAAGLCSCCSLGPRASSCFIFPSSCQCHVQPLHTPVPIFPSSPPLPPPPQNQPGVSPKPSPRETLPSSWLTPQHGHTETQIIQAILHFHGLLDNGTPSSSEDTIAVCQIRYRFDQSNQQRCGSMIAMNQGSRTHSELTPCMRRW